MRTSRKFFLENRNEKRIMDQYFNLASMHAFPICKFDFKNFINVFIRFGLLLIQHKILYGDGHGGRWPCKPYVNTS